MAKMRLDALLVERGLVGARSRAQALILAGKVLVNDQPITQAGARVDLADAIRLREPDHGYVSRGALKLLKALDEFEISVAGRIALDVGASTGGFTEVLLERGALRVHAVDVGQNQLHWKLRSDPRVRVREGLNARQLCLGDLGERFDIVTMDLSFISLTRVLPALGALANDNADWITLIKPQFEAGRENVGKGGIVRDTTVHQEVITRITAEAESLGLLRMGLIDSPIRGSQSNDGNLEFLAHWRGKRNE